MSSRAENLIAVTEQFGAHNYAPLPVVLARGEGCFVWDVDGHRYLDGLSGYSALNQGHRHPRIIAALVEQASRLTLTSRAFHNDTLGPFLEKLCGLAGFPRALPMNTGAEAVETAVKAMRRHAYLVRGVPEGEGELVVARGNFHGRTVLAVSLSDDPSSYAHHGPFVPGVVKVPFGDVDAVERALTPKTVGVLLEPIQGEAGVIIPPDDYLPRVRRLCSAAGVPLCLDEVQTGLGRTGKMFAWEHWSAKPDLICLAKALSGGVLPSSAVCGTAPIMDAFAPGTHGSTFGGNPLAAAVGMAALDVLIDERLPERAATLGADALESLRRGLAKVPSVREVRGKGLMLAVQFHHDVAHEMAVRVAREAAVLVKDTRGHTLRFLPPLVTPRDVLEEAVDKMVRVLARH